MFITGIWGKHNVFYTKQSKLKGILDVFHSCTGSFCLIIISSFSDDDKRLQSLFTVTPSVERNEIEF